MPRVLERSPQSFEWPPASGAVSVQVTLLNGPAVGRNAALGWPGRLRPWNFTSNRNPSRPHRRFPGPIHNCRRRPMSCVLHRIDLALQSLSGIDWTRNHEHAAQFRQCHSACRPSSNARGREEAVRKFPRHRRALYHVRLFRGRKRGEGLAEDD